MKDHIYIWNFKCLSKWLYWIFWALDTLVWSLKFISATVQAYFRLEKPVPQLIPYIERLEYDIYSEIGVPYTKVSPQASALIFYFLFFF